MILSKNEVYKNPMGKFDEAPPLIRDFLIYDEAVRGKAGTTTDEYYSDLKTFFRYIKMEKGLSPTGQPMEEIDISDVDINLIRQVTLSDLYSFMIYCKSERGNNETTRARKTVCLRMFFKYLTTKVGLLTVNPAEQLELPKARKSLPKYLTLEQSVALLESVDKASPNYQRDYCILTLFLNCGLRLAELCGLNLSDIRSDGTMRVVGKGNKERTVYLNDACVQAIADYLKVRPQDGLKGADRNALFISRLGKRLGRRGVQEMVSRQLAKIGLDAEGYSVHKLRHTAATLMYQHGEVDVRVLKGILGHESLSTTQIYTHVSNEQARAAAAANPLANIHPGQKEKK